MVRRGVDLSSGVNHMSRQSLGGSKKPANNGTAAPNAATSAHSSVEVKPNAEAVRRRAYELYLDRARTGKPGNELGDWAQAEQELAARK